MGRVNVVVRADLLAGVEHLARCSLRLWMNTAEARALGRAVFKSEKVDLSKIPLHW